MLTDYFPVFGLTLTTPRLTLRVPGPAELAALAGLAAEGVHDPAVMPFYTPWTDAAPDARARAVIVRHWETCARWRPAAWTVPFAVLAGETVVGLQDITGTDFAVTGEVGTGSWLGLRHHGRGYGTEMRAAVLHLAFAGLNAREATSEAFDDNAASLAVSRKLGYAGDGIERLVVRGAPVTSVRLRLPRKAWEAHRRVPVTVRGLAACLPFFGVTPAGMPSQPP